MGTNNTNIIYRDLSYQIMSAIFEVHKTLGPGYVESVYEKALLLELISRGMSVDVQRGFDLTYKGKKIGNHRLDLVVEDKIVVELKAVERFAPQHTAQLLSYLKASGYRLGILVNFSKAKVEYRRVVMG
ncbi:MAG: GxxExxY protein [Deltaproteobacteria bacterium]|nr:GxxExxY protein [Deltaproteobacteria bacterium]